MNSNNYFNQGNNNNYCSFSFNSDNFNNHSSNNNQNNYNIQTNLTDNNFGYDPSLLNNSSKKYDLYVEEIHNINNSEKLSEQNNLELFRLKKQKRNNLINANRFQNQNININSLNDDYFINDYISKIREYYEGFEYNNYVQSNGYFNFSTCPFCKYPVVNKFNRVFCINKCFETFVPENAFNVDFSLDNFVEQYYNFYLQHINCGDKNFQTIFIDNNCKAANFNCNKCSKFI